MIKQRFNPISFGQKRSPFPFAGPAPQFVPSEFSYLPDPRKDTPEILAQIRRRSRRHPARTARSNFI
jgi:hypothetical protein